MANVELDPNESRDNGWLVDIREVEVPQTPEQAFLPIQRIGGDTGWYYGNWLWRLRGGLDRLIGGVGMRRGRLHPENLAPGDALDCWQVERVVPGQLLLLRAEMKVPGLAWLRFVIEEKNPGSLIRQEALFKPNGPMGYLYWYSLYPAHDMIFRGMLRGIARAASEAAPTRR